MKCAVSLVCNITPQLVWEKAKFDFIIEKMHLLVTMRKGKGIGGGVVVSVPSFYSDDTSLNHDCY